MNNHSMIIKNVRSFLKDKNWKIKIFFILGHRSLPLFNGVTCRSIGVQCNPSTVDQTTLTSTKTSVMTDDELTLDRTIRILTPSSRVLTTNNLKRNGSHEFLLNGIKIEDENESEKEIIITSTCLDDDQMVIILFFSKRKT